MQHVSYTGVIHAPKSDVWEALDDFEGVAKWNPPVEQASIVSGPETGEGATRECVTEDGSFREQIVEYNPESSYTIEFVDLGPFPMNECSSEVSIRELDDSRTEVTFAGSYTPKYGPIGWLMAKLMMNSKMEEGYEEAVDGLAKYVED